MTIGSDSPHFSNLSFPHVPPKTNLPPSELKESESLSPTPTPQSAPEAKLSCLMSTCQDQLAALNLGGGMDEAKADRELDNLGAFLGPLASEFEALGMMLDLSSSQTIEIESLTTQSAKLSASNADPEKQAL